MKRTKEYLQKENEWLWWWHIRFPEETTLIETRGYDKNGKKIFVSVSTLPAKRFWPRHPMEKKK